MSSTELIELDLRPSSGGWNPFRGQETEDLLAHFRESHLDETGQHNLIESTARILRQCAPSNEPESRRTGLVVGYVQSGKTMSFTTVAAMAVDNGYPVVIVITGLSTDLYNQSAARLEMDLRFSQRGGRKWQHIREPRPNAGEKIARIIRDWRDATVPVADREILLITIKKNWSVLRRLIDIFQACDLRGIPALIIDDEADQASLNTRVNDQDDSPTYARINRLRDLFPCHTFLQYTATPQANLLINILDSLSPDFAELLTPGEDYTGGLEFFGGHLDLVRDIPNSQLPVRGNPSPDLPQTLVDALQVFFVGVAIGHINGDARRRGRNRSMLIHPSRETVGHQFYAQWVRGLQQHWIDTLRPNGDEQDRQELLEEFHTAYLDLSRTVDSGLPPWEQVCAVLGRAIELTDSGEVNATVRRIANINWSSDYSRILTGGQALDRGFTIEGLTVTYMPRGLGSMGGTADTLQQRARFFGYKRSYLGYCRLFLDADVRAAFSDYVDHEQSMREELNALRENAVPLKHWRRAFILSPRLNPTRRSVLSLSHLRGGFSDSWFQVRSPLASIDSCNANRRVWDEFLGMHEFEPMPVELFGQGALGHSGLFGVRLSDVHDQLLFQLAVPEPDENRAYVGALFQISRYLRDHPDELCDVYLMRPEDQGRRAVDADLQINQVFQGPNPNYPGDRAIHASGRLTIQLRRLTLTREGVEVGVDIPVLAIWVPAAMEQQWLVQESVSS
jgi:hypothetical protein